MENGELSSKAKNPVREKSYAFALHLVHFCRKQMHERKECIISKQLLRSGTSVGANVEEAQQGQSRKDFISKLCIALKEAHECHYWLRLTRDSDTDAQAETIILLREAEEIIRLLTAIIKKSKELP